MARRVMKPLVRKGTVQRVRKWRFDPTCVVSMRPVAKIVNCRSERKYTYSISSFDYYKSIIHINQVKVTLVTEFSVNVGATVHYTQVMLLMLLALLIDRFNFSTGQVPTFRVGWTQSVDTRRETDSKPRRVFCFGRESANPDSRVQFIVIR